MHFERRRRYPIELAAYPVVRLRSRREVERWLENVTKQQTVTSSVDPPGRRGDAK
jgi:hypothetical protein